jgi:hypothetical protein
MSERSVTDKNEIYSQYVRSEKRGLPGFILAEIRKGFQCEVYPVPAVRPYPCGLKGILGLQDFDLTDLTDLMGKTRFIRPLIPQR